MAGWQNAFCGELYNSLSERGRFLGSLNVAQAALHGILDEELCIKEGRILFSTYEACNVILYRTLDINLSPYLVILSYKNVSLLYLYKADMQIPRAALNNWRALQEKIEFPKSVSLSLNPSDATKWRRERERNAANFGIGGVGAPTTTRSQGQKSSQNRFPKHLTIVPILWHPKALNNTNYKII